MSKKTYTIDVDSEGQMTFTTFKVWSSDKDRSGVRSRTFKTVTEALDYADHHKAARVDMIVTTIIRTEVV